MCCFKKFILRSQRYQLVVREPRWFHDGRKAFQATWGGAYQPKEDPWARNYKINWIIESKYNVNYQSISIIYGAKTLLLVSGISIHDDRSNPSSREITSIPLIEFSEAGWPYLGLIGNSRLFPSRLSGHMRSSRL